MLVVVILDKTLAFQSDLASFTTVSNSVLAGISSWTLRQAFSVEIQEIPTREITSDSSKEKTFPTRFDVEDDDAVPLGCSVLPSSSVPTYVLLLLIVVSKYPPYSQVSLRTLDPGCGHTKIDSPIRRQIPAIVINTMTFIMTIRKDGQVPTLVVLPKTLSSE